MLPRPGCRTTRMLVQCAAIAALLTACSPSLRGALPVSPESTVELNFAISTDCPSSAHLAMESLCNTARELSGGYLQITLSESTSPLSAGGDAAFILSEVLAEYNPPAAMAEGMSPLAALNERWPFRSLTIGDDAYNSQTVLQALTQSLGGDAGYTAYASFYCGRTVLLTDDEQLTNLLLDDSEEGARDFALRVEDFVASNKPADANGRLHLEDTADLARSSVAYDEEFTLIDTPYVYRSGLLFFNNTLKEKAGERGYAAILEAVARAKPVNDARVGETEKAALAKFAHTVSLTERQRSIAREIVGGQYPDESPLRRSPLYKALEEFML